jgi:hypothetical protein
MATKDNNASLTKQALTKAFLFAAFAIPTLVSLTVAYQFKTMESRVAAPANLEPQIVCFEPNICAIEVRGKWYRIDGVILMDQTVPEEYRLNELIEEADPVTGIDPKAGAEALGSIVDSLVKPSPQE